MAAKQAAEKLISEHIVAVFSKSHCHYCTRAKATLSSLSLPASKIGIIELDNEGSHGAEIQAYLAEKTQQRTVPNIFINGKHIGGNDALQQINQSGELKKLIAAS
ncbi:glutaredoxin [Tilletiaria anomala UBC 951]|uniref:Glutaredoxin n=1 Tax=Tilletiaria anomala (strain ATCC 24038 / CBS 436.72 / UBC 951) TaxID=1037660 RepID=A0A066V3J0_TILAU|nr:glutaredoxin [Tilletiaria anomala UBC 951]KDN36016.1 glutaredoxin [Tilletiaria anomala UBC 951]